MKNIVNKHMSQLQLNKQLTCLSPSIALTVAALLLQLKSHNISNRNKKIFFYFFIFFHKPIYKAIVVLFRCTKPRFILLYYFFSFVHNPRDLHLSLPQTHSMKFPFCLTYLFLHLCIIYQKRRRHDSYTQKRILNKHILCGYYFI